MTTLRTAVYHAEIKQPKYLSNRSIMKWYNNLKPFDFIVPDDLLLITTHNYDRTFFEVQMEGHGVPVESYKVIKVDKDDTEVAFGAWNKKWSNFMRWKRLLAYIKSGEAKNKKYVLFADATDNLFVDSPHNILYNFKKYFHCGFRSSYGFGRRCDLLYCGTGFRGQERGDKFSKKTKTWYDARSLILGDQHHLNAGLFIGEKNFVIEVYERMLEFELDSRGKRNERLWRSHPEYPYGCASDQATLRYIWPEYYPRILTDSNRFLFARWSVPGLKELFHGGLMDRSIMNKGGVDVQVTGPNEWSTPIQ